MFNSLHYLGVTRLFCMSLQWSKFNIKNTNMYVVVCFTACNFNKLSSNSFLLYDCINLLMHEFMQWDLGERIFAELEREMLLFFLLVIWDDSVRLWTHIWGLNPTWAFFSTSPSYLDLSITVRSLSVFLEIWPLPLYILFFS